jgi:Transposase IS4
MCISLVCATLGERALLLWACEHGYDQDSDDGSDDQDDNEDINMQNDVGSDSNMQIDVGSDNNIQIDEGSDNNMEISQELVAIADIEMKDLTQGTLSTINSMIDEDAAVAVTAGDASASGSEYVPSDEDDDGDFQFCASCGLRTDGRHGTCDCPGPLTQLVQVFNEMNDEAANDGGTVVGEFTALLHGTAAPAVIPSARVVNPSAHEVDDDDDDLEAIFNFDTALVASVDADDINLVRPDEHSDEYEGFDSNESGQSDDEEVVVRREFPDEDEALVEEETALMDEAFIASLGGKLTLENMDQTALRQLEWGEVSSSFEAAGTVAYPNLRSDAARPSLELMSVATSPLQTFLYFVPKQLWIHIACETNRYKRQNDPARAVRLRRNQMTKANRTCLPETVKQIRRRLIAEAHYEAHEIVQVFGLLVAHMLCPRKGRFSNHWSMTEDGAMPTGTFSKYMPRNRCTNILRDLHFVNNQATRTRDKIWKLRPVVQVLQKRFLSGWTTPAVFSFDEGVLPATSRRNTTRMFMPDKPHRYGTKMFMVCDAASAYCHR